MYFIPAFGLLELNNVDKTSVATGFIGLKSNTTKAQMVRSIFDSLAFAIKLKMDYVIKDLKSNNINLRSIRYVFDNRLNINSQIF